VHSKNQESLDFNDALDGIRILLKYILSQKMKNTIKILQKSSNKKLSGAIVLLMRNFLTTIDFYIFICYN